MIDVQKAADAQHEYCEENELPEFAPRYGWCSRCGHNIYKLITVEEAGKQLITGCPICGYSFCD